MTDHSHITLNRPRRVEILAFEMTQLLDVAGPLQVFATANDLAAQRRSPAPYALEVIAPTAPSVRTSAGLGLVVTPLPPARNTVDTLIVAGGFGVNVVRED